MDKTERRRRARVNHPPSVVEIPEDEMPVFDDVLESRLRQSISKTLAAEDFEFPRLPSVALEVMRLADRPNATAKQIAELVQRDQFLTLRLVKAANSAVNAASARKIISLQEAVTRIGFAATHNIVLASSLNQVIYRGKRRALLKQIWRETVGCAVACELTASSIGKMGGRAFVIGLLHDIGRPTLVLVLEDLITNEYSGRIRFEEAWPMVQDLAPEVSRLILLRWDLPKGIATITTQLNTPSKTGTAQRARAMLRLARWLVIQHTDDHSSDGLLGELQSQPEAHFLHLTDSIAERLLIDFPIAWSRVLGEPVRTVADTGVPPGNARNNAVNGASKKPSSRPSPARPHREQSPPNSPWSRPVIIGVGVALLVGMGMLLTTMISSSGG